LTSTSEQLCHGCEHEPSQRSRYIVAIESLRGAKDACANLKPMAMEMTGGAAPARARHRESYTGSSEAQNLRNRAETLQGALDRFKARREARRA